MKAELFGIKNSNRDFNNKKSWGKNQFNSSFPAALACYIASKNIQPVYITINRTLKVKHTKISVSDIFGIDYNSPNLFFAFERDYLPYQNLVIGNLPRIDLVTINTAQNNDCLRGIEIKLTALPDNTTCELTEDKYGCEIVVRQPTITYLVVTIAKVYLEHRNTLLNYLQPVCSKIKDWTIANDVLPFLQDLIDAIDSILTLCIDSQLPLIMQPVWKTEGKSAKLCDYCLDIFIWSNLAFIKLFMDTARRETNIDKMSRHKRCVAWLTKMLYDFAQKGKIDPETTMDEMSFNTKNDKAFALSGTKTHQYMKSPELTKPRIHKNEIKNIILGGGKNFLSPERRLDAIILNTPGLFT